MCRRFSLSKKWPKQIYEKFLRKFFLFKLINLNFEKKKKNSTQVNSRHITLFDVNLVRIT